MADTTVLNLLMNNEHWLIGWCKQGTSDKVWGAIPLENINQLFLQNFRWMIFWGKRGNKLQTKLSETSVYLITTELDKKIEKGYRVIQPDQLHTVYADFKQDLDLLLMWHKLKI